MCNQVTDEGLATLLIEKGLITRVEYHDAMANAAERELNRWHTEYPNITFV